MSETAASFGPAEGEWTVDDLAKLPGDVRYELIDGRLILEPGDCALPVRRARSAGRVRHAILAALEAHRPDDAFVVESGDDVLVLVAERPSSRLLVDVLPQGRSLGGRCNDCSPKGGMALSCTGSSICPDRTSR
ncbi:hypothetical protein [Asanoa siamensis]|uniref:Restriction endonuclease n=1 Tax=Asanoa siamensis TaxID=926357 RepID=A0ABQ4CQ39_9ACTN|nr:hypothetical protein [Asanoa siamensis]GIF73133.1 hypothetical protein Asi02nite_26510 [Asanoa siamensis]